jgi:hypothetical protein
MVNVVSVATTVVSGATVSVELVELPHEVAINVSAAIAATVNVAFLIVFSLVDVVDENLKIVGESIGTNAKRKFVNDGAHVVNDVCKGRVGHLNQSCSVGGD